MDNKHFVDIPFTKESVVNEYVEAFDIKNDTIDFNKLDEYKNSKYTLNANRLQSIENVIDNIQQDWKSNVIDDLDNKLQIFQSWINNLATNAREWETGSSNKYYKNDVVTYNEDPGAYFICLEDCDGTEPINYVKFTYSSINKDSFNWGLCVNNEIDDSNESFIGTSEQGSINAFKLTYKYDGEYKLKFTKKSTFVGEINYLIFNGNREIFQHMNFVVDDSKWLRIYPQGNAGANSFDLMYKGEWEGEPGSITSLPKTIKILDNAPYVCFEFMIRSIANGYDFTIKDGIIFKYGERQQIIKHVKSFDISVDIFLNYNGDSYFDVYGIIFSGTVFKIDFADIKKNDPYGELIPFNIVYCPNDIVYIENSACIDFYVCTSEISIDSASPEQDSEHWVKLFSKQLDKFVILDEMPNQEYFDDDTNPSVFGVKTGQTAQSTIRYNKDIHGGYYSSQKMKVLDDVCSFESQISQNNSRVTFPIKVLVSKDNNVIENITLRGDISNSGTIVGGAVIYKWRIKGTNVDSELNINISVNFSTGLIEMSVSKLVLPDDTYTVEIYSSYINATFDMNIIKIIERAHSISANNPQYLKLQTNTSNVLGETASLNTLINKLIFENNI